MGQKKRIDITKEPDWSKPLSRFNAQYWAMMRGIAAALPSAEWSVLCAIYCHLPNIELGKGRLEAMSGRSESTVKTARKNLRTYGLISYADHDGGYHRDTATVYTCADIRQAAVADAVIARINGADVRPGQFSTGSTVDPVGGQPSTPYGADYRPDTGAAIDPKVRKGSSQGSSQEKNKGASPQAGAAAPGFSVADQNEKPAGSSSEAPNTSSANQTKNQTQPAKAKGKADNGRKPKAVMSDEDKVLACQSSAMMLRYLLWGVAGLREQDDSKLIPTATNWRSAYPAGTPEDEKTKHFSITHFAAFYWQNVSIYRESKGLPLTLPDLGRLCGAIKNSRKSMTAGQLAQRIANICGHFDLIRFELDWANIALDEGSLQDKQITKKVIDIENCGQFALDERYAKATAAGYCRKVEPAQAEAAKHEQETNQPAEAPAEHAEPAKAADVPAVATYQPAMFTLPPMVPTDQQSPADRLREAGLLVDEPAVADRESDGWADDDSLDEQDEWDGEVEPADDEEEQEEATEAAPLAA